MSLIIVSSSDSQNSVKVHVFGWKQKEILQYNAKLFIFQIQNLWVYLLPSIMVITLVLSIKLPSKLHVCQTLLLSTLPTDIKMPEHVLRYFKLCYQVYIIIRANICWYYLCSRSYEILLEFLMVSSKRCFPLSLHLTLRTMWTLYFKVYFRYF